MLVGRMERNDTMTDEEQEVYDVLIEFSNPESPCDSCGQDTYYWVGGNLIVCAYLFCHQLYEAEDTLILILDYEGFTSHISSTQQIPPSVQFPQNN